MSYAEDFPERLNPQKKEESSWTMDAIIQKVFPILGMLLIVSGLGYFFYTGFWEIIGQSGRIALGFVAGSAMILGGYTFSEKLRNFADVVIGGGVIMLYVSLIYGSRFEFAGEISEALFPESFVLMVAAAFAAAIAWYSVARKSQIILALGIVAAYATPFFIGQADGFATDNPYEISYLQFLLYFLVVNVLLFVASFKAKISSLMTLNILGFFLGTIALSGLIGGAMAQYPVLIPVIGFLVVAVQTLFFVNSSTDKNPEKTSLLNLSLPFLWLVTMIFGAMNNSEISLFSEVSLAGLLMILVSVLYFGSFHFIQKNKNPENFPAEALLYSLGVFSLVLAGLEILADTGDWQGLIFSGVAVVMAIFHKKTPLMLREIAILIFAFFGTLTVLFSEISGNFYGLSLQSLLFCLSLVPFLSHFFLEKTSDATFSLRKIAAYLSAPLIVIVLGSELFSVFNFRLDFLLGVIPAGAVAVLAYRAKTDEDRIEYMTAGLAFLIFGYAATFFSLWDKLFPAHSDLLFSSFEGVIGLLSLCIAGVLYWLSKQPAFANFRKKYGGTHLVAVMAFVMIAFQFVSYEIIALYNTLVEPSSDLIFLDSIGEDTAAIVGLRAVLISFWWVILSSSLLYVGIQNPEKFLQEKRIGMIMLAFTLGKILLYDISHLDTNLKVLLFVITGAIIMGISYAFHRKNND